jgi:hypothetical protein
MTGRMKVLLVALGALGFAAMNGSLPWARSLDTKGGSGCAPAL